MTAHFRHLFEIVVVASQNKITNPIYLFICIEEIFRFEGIVRVQSPLSICWPYLIVQTK